MKFKNRIFLVIFTLIAISIHLGCRPDNTTPNPDPTNPGNMVVSYGDSIIYLRNQPDHYIVTPQPTGKTGTWSAWPIGLEINSSTGAIDVNESETGMRYKVMFVPSGTRDTISAKIVIAGINYEDHYHIQAVNDSLSRPFYNARFGQFSLPSGCSFDVGGAARSQGLAIDPVTGVINLNQTIRNGFFGNVPARDGDKKEVTVYYKIPDASGNAMNRINVKLYFYNNMSTVETDITQLLEDRTTMFLRMANGIFSPLPTNMSRPGLASRPRPPCVIILGQR
jgi:hypothetical protein